MPLQEEITPYSLFFRDTKQSAQEYAFYFVCCMLHSVKIRIIYEGVLKNNGNCNIASERFVVTDFVASICYLGVSRASLPSGVILCGVVRLGADLCVPTRNIQRLL
jgi:hypothetical protein